MVKLLAALGILALAAFNAGCGNACDDAVERAEECGITLDSDEVDTDACSDADECVAECYTGASCETLEREDMLGSMDLTDCVNACR